MQVPQLAAMMVWKNEKRQETGKIHLSKLDISTNV